MSNENTSIHDFDFSLICEYFSYMKRQGPGSNEMTMKALSFIDNIPNVEQIADLGCGTGAQTMVLAQNCAAKITAIDLFPEFIDILKQNAIELNLQDKIEAVTGSMDNLPFAEQSLDIIWAEGSIYNIGFEQGMNYWHKFLKKGGYVAVTEASWFTNERPEEIQQFWTDAYPEIDTVSNKVALLQKAGYYPVANFILPENCWNENFYQLQAEAQNKFLKKYAGNKTAEDFVANERREADLYRKYKEFYGYVFYIGKKIQL